MGKCIDKSRHQQPSNASVLIGGMNHHIFNISMEIMIRYNSCKTDQMICIPSTYCYIITKDMGNLLFCTFRPPTYTSVKCTDCLRINGPFSVKKYLNGWHT